MQIELKDLITLLTGLAGSAAITKFIEYRQAVRKQKADAPAERAKLELEREKADEEADDRLIKALMDERERDAVRHQARVSELEGRIEAQRQYYENKIEAQRQREVQQIQTNSEYQMQIQVLTRQVAALEKQIADRKEKN